MSREPLPADSLRRLADAEAVAELLEGREVARIGTVKVFAFGNQLEFRVPRDSVAVENLRKWREIVGIDDEKLVLVELDFHWPLAGDDRYSGTAVVEEQFFKIAEVALEDWHVDLFAEQIPVPFSFTIVAGFQDDIGHFAQWLQEFEENVE